MSRANSEALKDSFKELLRGDAISSIEGGEFLDGTSVLAYSHQIDHIVENSADPFSGNNAHIGISIELDISHLVEIRHGAQIAEMVYRTPRKTLEMLSDCFKDVVLERYGTQFEEWIPDYHVRVHNIDDIHHIKIRNLGSFYTERMVKVVGLVTRMSEIKPLLQVGQYQCPLCNEVFSIEQEQPGQYTSPSSKWKICPNPDCNNRKVQNFNLIERLSKLTDWQTSYLQEPPEDLPPGTTPKGIEMIFTDDYVERISPGIRAEVTGILYFRPAFNPGSSSSSKDPIFDKFIEVVHVKAISDEDINEELTEDDINAVMAVKDGCETDEELENIIINSVARSMYGYREIKHGIALLMFSGVEHLIENEGRQERGDLNILLAGDPSTGKSVEYSERVYIGRRAQDGTKWVHKSIGSIVDALMIEDRESVIKKGESEVLVIDETNPIYTMSMDPLDLKIKKSRVLEVSRHKASELVKITTKGGRSIKATPDHSFTTIKKGILKVVDSKDLFIGTKLPVAKKITLCNEELSFSKEVFWDEIINIEYIYANDTVYDIGTEHGHFVVANGNIITHNSQLLHYMQGMSPRNAYVSGKKSTAAGITAAVLKDPRTGILTLEAGAVVFASGGICMIDEFDKVRGDDLDALLEVMVSQHVSINKAGIQARLPAKCSILAAMNPKFLRYRHDLSFAENMNLEETISSRFDLIFLMTDDPEENFDSQYSDWVLDMFDTPDSENLISGEREALDHIPKNLLMKYVRHAKEEIHPIMSREAKERAKHYWMELRRASYGGQAMTADRRTLNTIRRLGEANAKLCLREEVNEHDIDVAYDLYQYSLRQIGLDELTGEYDLDAVRGMSHAMQNISVRVKKTIMELEDEADAHEDYEKRDGVPFSIILDRVRETGIIQDREGVDVEVKLEEVLKTLYDNHTILMPKDGTSGERHYRVSPIRRRSGRNVRR